MVKLQSTNEEKTKCEWLLSTINIDLWHVQIINEDYHLLAGSLWSVLFESLFIDILHEVLLKVSSRSPRREVDVQDLIFITIELGEAGLDSDCFGCSRLTAEASWLLQRHYLFQEP